MFLTSPIPCAALRRLEFLLGQFDGNHTIYPADQPPIRSQMHSDASWETSDRYIRIEVFYRASTSMYESIVGMIGYDSEQDLYRMWMFARSQSEPMYLSGNFVDGSLILVSEPATMAGGIEKMRYSYTPGLDGGFEIIGERWTLEGWARYCTAHLQSEVFAD